MTSALQIDQASWPVERVGEALEELARRAGFMQGSNEIAAVPANLDLLQAGELGRWMDWASRRLSIEAESISVPVTDFTQIILRAGPALLYVPRRKNQDPALFVLLKSGLQTLHLIGPDLRVHRCSAASLRAALCSSLETPFEGEINRLLDTAKVPPHRRAKARQAMLNERLAVLEPGQCWLLRSLPTHSFWQQITQIRLPNKLAMMLGTFAIIYAMEVVGWGLIGQITLNGRLDYGWLVAWALLVLSLVPLQVLGGWLDATFALSFGRMLKTRLLAGILRTDLDIIRRQGAGQLLSRVMESQALESLALNGGLGVLVAILELVFAATILATGAGGQLHLMALAAWLLLTLGLSYRYFHCLKNWTLMRLGMTQDLVEGMVGHRTRLAQERPLRRDEQEDRAMRDYLETSKAMDRAIVPAAGLMSRGWMLVGLIGLAPAFVTSTGTPAGLAIALGGMLLANRALEGISSGLAALSRAAVAWKQVAILFYPYQKAAAKEPFLSQHQISGTGAHVTTSKLIDASQLSFRYHAKGKAVLQALDLSIYGGEKILLEGPSGGGKSTLASLLVGLRSQDSGLLLINGLDRQTLGDTWHQLATEAPQFHENHILSGSLAFNLLMGRSWPATEDQIADARQLCVELGLGELLQRMPSGMMQMVGETGWQLSHGERSRIFLGRALLQNAQLTILDESFAALDPETLEKCLQCALRRTQTLLVIAHP